MGNVQPTTEDPCGVITDLKAQRDVVTSNPKKRGAITGRDAR